MFFLKKINKNSDPSQIVYAKIHFSLPTQPH